MPNPATQGTTPAVEPAQALRLVVGPLRGVPDDLADDGLAAPFAPFLGAATGLAGAAFQ